MILNAKSWSRSYFSSKSLLSYVLKFLFFYKDIILISGIENQIAFIILGLCTVIVPRTTYLSGFWANWLMI